MKNIWSDIETRIRAGYPFLYLISHEETRLARKLQTLAVSLGYEFERLGMDAYPQNSDPLVEFARKPGPGILVLHDFHLLMNDVFIIRKLKSVKSDLSVGKKTVIVTAPHYDLPAELDKYFSAMEIPLPDQDELTRLFTKLCPSVGTDNARYFGRAATGLTEDQAIHVFQRILLEPERIKHGDTGPVIEEKRRLVESEGVLLFYDRDVSLSDVGGLHALKDWLGEREAAFDQTARNYGLPEPKGLLLLGVQGCGKSLTAKAVASHWRLPLVQFDLAATFSSLRSPEETLRRALQLLEALSPVVVWIDEVEKAFAGAKQSGEVAVHRVFGHFITWMQEKRKPVFVVATANAVEELPPELLRKGRFDELFFVDLPDEKERAEILKIHIQRRMNDNGEIDIPALVEMTRNYTGAELEQVVLDALYRAFSKKRKAEQSDFEKSAEKVVPIYNTYEEDIKRLRDWAKDRTRKASLETGLTSYFQKEG